MRYSLSYDDKKSKERQGDELRENIVRLLLENNAVNLLSPIESNIIFEDTETNPAHSISKWNGLINETFHEDIYHYLCIVMFDDNIGFYDRCELNTVLRDNFNEIVTKISQEITMLKEQVGKMKHLNNFKNF
jgi:hypothetical protein